MRLHHHRSRGWFDVRFSLRFVIPSLLAAILSVPATASAQLLEPPRARQGYYLAVGLLSGASRTWEDGDSLGTWRGSAFSLRIGQLLTRRFGLGLQIGVGASKDGQETGSTFGLGLESHFELARNFAVHAGVGLGVLQIRDARVEDEELRATYGAEYVLGLSYAIYPWRSRRSGGFSLTPVAQARVIPGSDASGLAILVGLEFAWWTGLPSNQLDLPESDAYREASGRQQR